MALETRFIDAMAKLHDEHAVFLSLARRNRYFIESVDGTACSINRVDGSEPQRCTETLYQQALDQVRSAGGLLAINNVLGAMYGKRAMRAAFVQGPHLAISGDNKAIADISTQDRALAVFKETLINLNVDTSGGSERPYKPALVASVIDGVAAGELVENRITYEWVQPRLIEKLKWLGVDAGNDQAALAFFHLSGDYFWLLCYPDPRQPLRPEQVSPGVVRERITHARMKDAYWDLLLDPTTREQIRETLMERWFGSRRRAWIFQGNPQIYDVRSAIRELPEVVWSVRQHEEDIRTGDRVFFWQSGASGGIVGVGDILDNPEPRPFPPGEARFTVKPDEFSPVEDRVTTRVMKVIDPPFSRERMRAEPGLENALILRFANNTNYRLEPREAEILEALLMGDGLSGSGSVSADPLDQLAAELLLEASFLREVIELLKQKRQAIFYGPPGTGKTFIARALARFLTREGGSAKLIQFHPSYAYEDFVEGFRPSQEAGEARLVLRAGPLKRIAKEAAEHPDTPYILLIDEINRGNVAKVFGELYFLLEYRDEPMNLQYSDDEFRMPPNLWMIGTMNTADRSIALLDAALRRRFYFIPFMPEQEPIHGLLRRWLLKNAPELVEIADVVDLANARLGDRHTAIGPSHFMRRDLNWEWIGRIWKLSIIPYLEELFVGEEDRLKDFDLNDLRRSVRTQESQ